MRLREVPLKLRLRRARVLPSHPDRAALNRQLLRINLQSLTIIYSHLATKFLKILRSSDVDSPINSLIHVRRMLVIVLEFHISIRRATEGTRRGLLVNWLLH